MNVYVYILIKRWFGVCEATVAAHFVNNLQNIKPTVNGLEILKCSCMAGEKCFAWGKDDNLRIRLENCYKDVFLFYL